MAAAQLVIEKCAHFKGRAESDGLRTRELAGNARNRGPDSRYDEDSEPAFTQKRGDVLKNLGSDLGTASPMQARPPLPRRNKPTKFSTARLQLAAVQNAVVSPGACNWGKFAGNGRSVFSPLISKGRSSVSDDGKCRRLTGEDGPIDWLIRNGKGDRRGCDREHG
jgi:hypothetical protein